MQLQWIRSNKLPLFSPSGYWHVFAKSLRYSWSHSNPFLELRNVLEERKHAVQAEVIWFLFLQCYNQMCLPLFQVRKTFLINDLEPKEGSMPKEVTLRIFTIPLKCDWDPEVQLDISLTRHTPEALSAIDLALIEREISPENQEIRRARKFYSLSARYPNFCKAEPN